MGGEIPVKGMKGKIHYTEQEKMVAVQMIREGKKYAEVSEQTGMSTGYLSQIARAKCNIRQRGERWMFPGLEEYMKQHHISPPEMAKKMQLTVKTFDSRRRGSAQFRYEEIRTLLAITGMDFETLFREF